jgi:hypothetical protein
LLIKTKEFEIAKIKVEEGVDLGLDQRIFTSQYGVIGGILPSFNVL